MSGFTRDPPGIYRSDLLSRLSWLDHGFGTRHADPHPSPATLKQIHSDIVLRVPVADGCEGDALLAVKPGEVVAVKTADCLPVLIADTVNRVAAAVHAGWKGTTRAIVQRAVEHMHSEFHSEPSSLHVALGPSIGFCCYEVGPEVAELFKPIFPERSDLAHRAHLDLPEANRRLLISAGVPEGNIALVGLCTRCAPNEFHSWRRDREKAGRMLSVVGIR
jgi:YfiH family protein